MSVLSKRFSILIISCITLLFLLESCNQKFSGDVVKTDIIEYTDSVAPVLLHGRELPLEILGANYISVCDRWMIVNTSNKSAQITIVSLDSLKEIMSICPDGQARTDLSNPYYTNRQFVKNEDGWNMIVIDNYSKAKYLNLDKTVALGKTIVDKSVDFEMSADQCVFVNDSVRLDYHSMYYDEDNEGYTGPKFIVVNDTLRDDIPVFGDVGAKSFNFNDDRTLRRLFALPGTIQVIPDMTMAVCPSSVCDYITLIDIEDESSYVIELKGGLSFDEYVNSGRSDYSLHSVDCFTTDKFFIVLYAQDDIPDDPVDLKNPYVRVFDWTGKFIRSFELDQRIECIAYDENSGVLYGLDRVYETIFAFDIEL